MSTPTGVLFNDPNLKPLSTMGQQQAGAYYLFYLTGTLTTADVYADGPLTAPLSQTPGAPRPSCTADSAGRFNPIYLNPSMIYRVQLYSAGGVKLEDTDPYVVSGLPNRANIGAVLYPQTAAESAAGVTPVNHWFPPGYVDRYATNTRPGTTDMTTPIQNAINVACKQIAAADSNHAEVTFLGSIYGISAALNLNPYASATPPPVTVKGIAKKLYPNFTTDWQTPVPSWGYGASTVQYISGSHGAIFSGGTNCDIDGLVIRCGQERTRADLVWSIGTEPSQICIQRCLFQNLTWIANNSAAPWGAWTFHDNQVIGCGQGPYVGGLFQGAMVDMEVYGNVFTSTNGYVFHITSGGADSIFSENRFEEGNSPAFLINAGSRQHVITSNVFDNHNTAAIELNAADPGQTIVGNFFDRNGSYGGATPHGGSAILNACHIYIINSGGHWIDNEYDAAVLDNDAPCTINIGTSTITFNNTYVAGQPVQFSTTGSLPTGIVAGNTYFVSATKLSSRQFRISSSYANGIAGTSIALSGSQRGTQTVTTFNPIWIIGLESVSSTPPTRFGGQTRHGCATSQIVADRYGTSANALTISDSIDLPAGGAPATASDDLTTALRTLNQVCVAPVTVNLYENRYVNSFTGNLSHIHLRGIGASAPTLTNNSGATGFQSMDNISYGGLGYTVRRGQQYAASQPNSSRTNGQWQVGDVILSLAPAGSSTAGWVLVTLGYPDTWKTWGSTGP